MSCDKCEIKRLNRKVAELENLRESAEILADESRHINCKGEGGFYSVEPEYMKPLKAALKALQES